MQIYAEATYKNGSLVLDHVLGNDQEGKKFKVILFEEKDVSNKKDKFFQAVKKHSFILPKNYKFNRNGIHEW